MTVRASAQGVTFSMCGQLYRGHVNTTALVLLRGHLRTTRALHLNIAEETLLSEMNLMDGKLSMRSREPCGLILTIVSECAYASYPTSHPSHEQSRKYTCYMKCPYSSEVECLCSAGARFRIIHVGFT